MTDTKKEGTQAHQQDVLPGLFSTETRRTNPPNQNELELELIESAPAPDNLPDYMNAALMAAGIPVGLVAGQSLKWINACNTSVVYLSASAQVGECAEWIDMKIEYCTGRLSRLRLSRYETVLDITDSAGLDGAESLSNAAARIMLEFKSATRDLMIRH